MLLASHNEDKRLEILEILAAPSIHLEIPRADDPCLLVEENGSTYVANATIKARAAHKAHGGEVLADDSGLSVDALDGFPGIYSARFAGEATSYPDKISALYALLKEVPQEDWTASFHCAIVYINKAGEATSFEGKVEGLLLPESRGSFGFGYDPIFYIPHLGKTTAELLPSEKHKLSHRGKALEKFKAFYLEVLREQA